MEMFCFLNFFQYYCEIENNYLYYVKFIILEKFIVKYLEMTFKV